jgi:hypothetical protein
MGTRNLTRDLQCILEQQASIDAALFTEQDVLRYINRICVSLEEIGFVPPGAFTIGRLLRAIEEEVLPALLAEDATQVTKVGPQGAIPHAAKKQGFLSRAVGAVKGAIQRGVTRAATKLRQHHSAKASAALDAAANPEVPLHVATKAAKTYAKHYVKAAKLSKRLNPKTHAALSKSKADAGDPEHGTRHDAAYNVWHARKTAPTLQRHKLNHAHQLKITADVKAAKAQRAAKSAQPSVASDATNPGIAHKGI